MGVVGAFIIQSITVTFGILYPAYQSFKAINGGDEVKQLEWLMYWTVAGFCAYIEHWFGLILSWVPLYDEGKLVIMIWLSIGGGAAAIYRGFLHSYLLSHEKEIDDRISLAARQARMSVANVGQSVIRFTRERSASVLKSVTERMVMDQWSTEIADKLPRSVSSEEQPAQESQPTIKRRASQPTMPPMPKPEIKRVIGGRETRSSSAFAPRRSLIEGIQRASGPIRARRTQRLAEIAQKKL